MKLIWKLSAPQICLVISIGLVSFAVIHSSFTKMRDEYIIRAAVESRFQRISRDIEDQAKASVIQASMVAGLPVVIKAYEIALSGDIKDPYSPQSQAAREMLRRELAPVLEGHHKMTGEKLHIHFHLPNGLSLVRLLREKNTRIDGKWVDISDDISWYRHTVVEVNKTGNAVMGLEPGSGGFAIRGVIPVKTPGGRHLGSAEVLQDFDSLLAAATVSGEMAVSLYANKELLEFSIELQDVAEEQRKGDFVRVSKRHAFDAMITPELLLRGKTERFSEGRGDVMLEVRPLADYTGNQVGVMVCAMDTRTISGFMRTAGIILALMLALMVMASSSALLLGSRKLVINPLNKIKAKIEDITEDRADLSEQIPSVQEDEIGDLARCFNKLTAKVDVMLNNLHEAVRKKTETEASLAKEKDFSQATINSISDAVITMNKDGFVITMNDTAEIIVALGRSYTIGKHISDVFTLSSGEEIGSFRDFIEKSLQADLPSTASETFLMQTGDVLEKHISFNCSPIRSVAGEILGAVLIFRDISEMKKHEEKMEFLSYHDTLTGLYNRAFFEESCKTIDQENITPVTIIIGDANGLKQINDVYGHAAGDILLQAIANAFKNACRSNDIIARWGGDEFAAILPGLTGRRVKRIMQNIHNFCATAKTEPVKVSVALGMATRESLITSLSRMFAIAEKRMYKAKQLMKQSGMYNNTATDSENPAGESGTAACDPAEIWNKE